MKPHPYFQEYHRRNLDRNPVSGRRYELQIIILRLQIWTLHRCRGTLY